MQHTKVAAAGYWMLMRDSWEFADVGSGSNAKRQIKQKTCIMTHCELCKRNFWKDI